MSKKWELEQALRDKAMRRALLEMLQEATKNQRPGGPDWPEPMRDDDQVVEELHRILKIRRFWPWG